MTPSIQLPFEILWCIACGVSCVLIIILNQLNSIARALAISCSMSAPESPGLASLYSIRTLTASIIQRNRFLEEQLEDRFSFTKLKLPSSNPIYHSSNEDASLSQLSSMLILSNAVNAVLVQTLACGAGIIDQKSRKHLKSSDLPEAVLDVILQALLNPIKAGETFEYLGDEPGLTPDMVSEHVTNKQADSTLGFYGIKLIKSIPIIWRENSRTQIAILWSAYRSTQMPTSVDNEHLKYIKVEAQRQLDSLEVFARLNQERQVAQKIAEERLNFISHLSHDIRTPLANIQNIFYLLSSQRSDDQKVSEQTSSDFLALGINNCIRLNSMIGDILDFTKHQVGRLRAIPIKVDLKNILIELINENSIKADEQGVRFIIEQSTAINSWDQQIGLIDNWREVSVDARHIRRILLNFITNVIHHCPQAEVRICSRLINETHLVLTIEDNGPGMARDKLRAIFEPYGDSRSGYGLGLSLTKVLCELNSIALRIDSAQGIGTTVTLEIPLYCCT